MEKSAATTRDWLGTARTLSEALPYLQRYNGATVVIKFGGHAMGDEEEMDDLRPRRGADEAVPGEPGDRPRRRPDDQRHAEAARHPLDLRRRQAGHRCGHGRGGRDGPSGRINKSIVQAINAQGGKAVGLSGKDANLMICEKDSVERDGRRWRSTSASSAGRWR